MDSELTSETKSFIATLDVATLLVDKAVRERFTILYKETFGNDIECSYCPKKLRRDIKKLKSSLVNPSLTLNSKTMSNYKFKPSTRVYSRIAKLMITEHNLSDGNAVALIAENPNYVNLFEKTAPDFEKEVEALKKKIADREDRILKATSEKEASKKEVAVKSAEAIKSNQIIKAAKIDSKKGVTKKPEVKTEAAKTTVETKGK